jgi:hypothetical protein
MSDGVFEKKTIGTLEVWQEQVDCANNILKVFYRNGGPPLLVAQMQQGKTGVVVCVVNEFINYCETKNLRYEIIYLTNISDNVLKDQNNYRLLKAGLLSKVKVIQHSNLKGDGCRPDLTADVRLVIIDECHVALEKLKPLHEFLKTCGIDYGNRIDNWKNKNNFVLSVSGTPFAHIIRARLDQRAFEPVVLAVSENYYSLQQMKAAGRFRQSEPVVKKGEVTQFFKDRMVEFLMDCKTHGEGHMVVRAIGVAPESLQQYITANHPNVDVCIFESTPGNNIGALERTLSTEIPKPLVAIIRGSLRAGKTLTTTQYIRMWIEPSKSSTDTMCQAVGRSLGFELVNGKNRRSEDKFPVYCNIKELDLAIEFYNGLNCVPTGNWNSKSDKTFLECDIKILPYSSDAEVKAAFKDVTISRCSVGLVNSYAEIVLKKQLRGYSKDGTKQRIYLMDKASPNYPEDWKKVIAERKDVEHKYILVKPIAPKTERSYSGKLDKNILFRSSK